MATSEFTWTLDSSNKISVRPELSRMRSLIDSVEPRRWSDGRVLTVGQGSDSTLSGWGVPVRWNWQIETDSALALQLTMNHSSMDVDSSRLEDWSDEPSLQRRNARHTDSTNYFLDLDLNTELPGGHAITAGAKLVRNKADTEYNDLVDGMLDISLAVLGRTSDRLMDSGRLFLQDEWRIDRSLAVNVGVSVERRVYEFNEGVVRNRADFNMWSPSVHLSKKIGGNSKRQFRLSLARSFQPPTADQMLLHPTINPFAPCQASRLCAANEIDTADNAGNPNLRPERALGLNLSYTHGIGTGSEMLLEWYARDITDKTGWEYALENVAWASAPRYVYRPVNLGQAKVRGVNLEGRLAGRDISKDLSTLEVHGSLGFAHSELSDIPGPDNRIPDQSPWRAKLGGSYTPNAIPLKLGVEASVLPADWIRNNLSERVYQSTKTTLGLNASWKIDAKARLTVNLDNLLHRTGTRIDEYGMGLESLRLSTRNADYARLSVKFDTSL
jgi:outer membrane receptor protein involved in Fe transport